MKELREARKVNKQGKHLEAEKIKAELEAKMGERHSQHNPEVVLLVYSKASSLEGSDKRVVEKAVRKAVAKHYSQVLPHPPRLHTPHPHSHLHTSTPPKPHTLDHTCTLPSHPS